MKILVLNGSPKGAQSVTMQYVAYLAKIFPQHSFEMEPVAQRIRRLEKDQEEFRRVIEKVSEADAILWAFPVYYTLVPSQYKRFIELIAERGAAEAFMGRYAAALTTSIHFFDHTAQRYIREVCEDLGMAFVDGYSADMSDLFHQSERKQVRLFAEAFFRAVENRTDVFRLSSPLSVPDFTYRASSPERTLSKGSHRIAVITDSQPGDQNLDQMVTRFCGGFEEEIPVYNLHDLEIKGGCLGCLLCGYDNHCRYEGVDAYIDFYRDTVMGADILVLAGRTRDRFLSSRWKCFFDRSFFNTHTPTLQGKQIGLIVSGPFSQLFTLQQSLQGWFEIHPANWVGTVSDECADMELLDRQLDALGQQLVMAADHGAQRPVSFLGLGGRKIFRDDIYGRLRGVFQADHRAYRKLGWYDFPGRSLRQRLANAGMAVVHAVKPVREEFQKRIIPGMIAPYQRLLERIDE